MNELMQKQITLKELEFYIKVETDCRIQGKIKTCIDENTQIKFDKRSPILDQILSFQTYLEDKTCIEYTKASD